jgi:FkbM family methyltransferase
MTFSEHLGFLCRDGTNDAPAVAACFAADEYHIRERKLSGWAIDVGAHIGTVAILMARQFPDLRVLAVEAVPDNSDLLERNIARFGYGERITSIRAWAARPNELTGICHYGYRHRDAESDDYVSQHRFVGNTWIDLGEPEFSVEMPAVSLDALLETYAIDEVSLLKIDCEGCEWAFLDTPAIAKVHTISGEYHGGYPGHPNFHINPMVEIMALLDATHNVKILTNDPSVGLFEATRR